MAESAESRQASPSTEQPGATASARPGQEQEDPPAIDVEALAERVYKMMLADARLERARRG